MTIINKSEGDYEVINVMEEYYSNSNIKYELVDLEKGTVIAGNTIYKFKIKLTSNIDDLQNVGVFVLKYNFIGISKERLFDYTGDEQVFIAPYGGTYKLEVWGAHGGTENLEFGRGGYSIGTKQLKQESDCMFMLANRDKIGQQEILMEK